MNHNHPSSCRLGSHISERKVESLSNMHQVMFLVKWPELRYCYHIYRQGLAYLEATTGDDAGAFAAMERSRIYWAWWKNYWHMRDEDFILEVEADRFLPREYRARYEDLHDGKMLALGIAYYGELMEASWDRLFPKLMREAQRNAREALISAGI